MKKILLFVLLLVATASTFAQEKTLNSAFYKTKMGHGWQFQTVFGAFVDKFWPANGNNPRVAYNITGGQHHTEVLVIYNIGKSFTDRDLTNNIPDGYWDYFNFNVAPHVDNIIGDVMVYRPDYSNSAFGDRSDKAINTLYEIKGIGNSKVFTDILKKFPKVWDKMGLKVACYTTTTGTDRLITARRLPNGWKELDDTSSNFPTVYDEIYGKGSFDKDAIVVSSWRTRIDRFMITKNKEMSSK